MFWIGKRVRGDQDALGFDTAAKHVWRNTPATRSGNSNHLTRADVEVEDLLVDSRRVAAVMARRIGVSAQVHRGVKCRERDVVAAAQITKHFAARRSIPWPNG